jgi:hypothetical protein
LYENMLAMRGGEAAGGVQQKQILLGWQAKSLQGVPNRGQ